MATMIYKLNSKASIIAKYSMLIDGNFELNYPTCGRWVSWLSLLAKALAADDRSPWNMPTRNFIDLPQCTLWATKAAQLPPCHTVRCLPCSHAGAQRAWPGHGAQRGTALTPSYGSFAQCTILVNLFYLQWHQSKIPRLSANSQPFIDFLSLLFIQKGKYNLGSL